MKVRSWTYHLSQSCSQRHLLVSFCKPPNSSTSLQCSGSGKSSYWFPKFEQFVRTNGSVPPNLRSREKRKAGRKVLLSCWKVKKMHQKHIQKLIDICGTANPSKMWVATNFHWAKATQYPSWEKGTNATKGGPHKTMHVFFRALSEKGGGFTHARIFWPFFYQLMDDTEILSLKQILIWYWYRYVYVFCHHYHQNYHHYYHNYHYNHYYNQWYFFSVIRAKRRFDVRKKVTKLPELEGGRGGVYLIWAMPERKRAFTYEVFPKSIIIMMIMIINIMIRA